MAFVLTFPSTFYTAVNMQYFIKKLNQTNTACNNNFMQKYIYVTIKSLKDWMAMKYCPTRLCIERRIYDGGQA